MQRLEASIRLFDAILKQNRTLRQETAALAEALTRASRFAYHDELTRLPNRRLLQYRLDPAADVTMDRNKVSRRAVPSRVLEAA